MAYREPSGHQVEAGVTPNRLLVVSDTITATQFISFLQPLQSLVESTRLRMFFENCPASDSKAEALFNELNPDCLILSRCTLPGGDILVKLARERRVPYIYHLDDDLLRVPLSLGHAKFKSYNSPARLKRLTDFMNRADLVYVSTPQLLTALRASGIAGHIEAGSVYCAIDPGGLLQPMTSTNPLIGYMGTSGHFNDLMMILPAIERLLDDHPSLGFEVFGTIQMPKELERFGSRVISHAPEANYVGFIRKLHSLGWWVGLAPLEDNTFNACKADTKWVEYASAGIAVVASDVPVYHRACGNGAGILVPNDGDWYKAVSSLLRDASQRQRMIERAYDKLRQDYTQQALQRQVLGFLHQAQVRAQQRT